MSLLINCPLPASINDLSDIVCPEIIGQVQKLVFQRRQSSAPFSTFEGATAGGADLIASWDAYKTAVDDTKVATTPFFDSFTIPMVEAVTEGGDDNTTLDGAELVVGTTTVTVTGQFRNLPAANLRQLKAYNAEQNLTIYMINESGKIWGQNLTGDEFSGTSIYNFFIADGGNEGKNTHDKTAFRFSLRCGWRDNLVSVDPADFDALTQL